MKIKATLRSVATRLSHRIAGAAPPAPALGVSRNADFHAPDYNAEKYWTERHIKHRRSFRGVGNITLSEEENIREYVAAVGTVDSLFRAIAFDPRGKNTLDVGCGNGFWTAVLRSWGISAYTGVDITDAMFDLLRERFPDAKFLAGRVQPLALKDRFQLITMIDVSQHIIDDAELLETLTCLRSLLDENGVFVVTFWNRHRLREDAHETFRTFEFYTSALEGMKHTDPIPFRDKFIAAFFRAGRLPDDEPAPRLTKESIIGIAKQIVA